MVSIHEVVASYAVMYGRFIMYCNCDLCMDGQGATDAVAGESRDEDAESEETKIKMPGGGFGQN